MKYSMGPVQYYWTRKKMDDFYSRVADAAIDIVYLGETVCNKRREYSLKDYMHTAFMLKEAGKEVVLSSITLVESLADLRELRKYCDNGEFLVEANDIGAAAILEELALPYVIGSSVNCYSHYTLFELFHRGMRRWVTPVELGKDDLGKINAKIIDLIPRDQLEIEVLVYGFMPLAWSARCFTARSENRSKDECNLCCINYPKGRRVSSQDGGEMFTLNGLQTQSGSRLNLLKEVSHMHNIVDVVRINPAYEDNLEWLKDFRENDVIPCDGALDCNGYWFKMSGIAQVP